MLQPCQFVSVNWRAETLDSAVYEVPAMLRNMKTEFEHVGLDSNQGMAESKYACRTLIKSLLVDAVVAHRRFNTDLLAIC